MKVTMEKDALTRLLDGVVGMIPTRSSLPILTNILIEATAKKGVRLTATDLDVSVTLAGNAQVGKEGTVTVPGKLFAEIVRSAPSGELTMTVTDHRMELTCPGRTFRLMGMDGAEFPRVPAAGKGSAFEIDPDVLPELISRTAYAVSRDETRPALNGVLWELSGKELRMVATDGHRLAFYKVKGEFPVGEARQVIVPPKSLTQLQRLLREDAEDGQLTVELGENQVRWRTGESEIFSKLIEGPFPKYDQVIPKDSDRRLLMNRESFMEEVRAVATVSDSLTKMVRMSLSAEAVKLSTRSADVGEAEVVCAGVGYEGDAIEVGYNATYLLEALSHMSADKVELLLKTQVGPGLLREVDGEEGPAEYLCLVMPLRLAD
jgi:DNA polymerase-3 subunit beta